MTVTLYHGDCLEILPTLEAGSVDLVFVDPPYNIGVFAKMPPDEYLDWCEQWISACSQKLKPNGAFWVSHKDPDVLVNISQIIAKYGRDRINWVTWDKYNGADQGTQYVMNRTKLHPQGKRAFDADAEYLIFHADEGQWTAQCDEERGFIFEPIRAYLEGERQRADISKEDINEFLGFRRLGGMAGRHYFSRSQWQLPIEEHYAKMQALFNEQGQYPAPSYEDHHTMPRFHFERDHHADYEYLRADYEYLRADYEDLRYTFNNPGLVSSVWQIPPAPKNGHPTPKPVELMERIILTTSNPGDVVLDPMMGSGTTGVACVQTGRDFIGIEIDEGYFNIAKGRIEKAQNEMVQAELL
jgi:adenine-specific DNA-methyltransferase